MKRMILTAVAAAFLAGVSASAFAEPGAEGQTAQVKKSPWLTSFAAAQAAARKGNKVIFVNFTGSDWCGWCIRLNKEVLSQKAFLDYAGEKLILLKIDFPRRIPQTKEQRASNRALADKYGIEGYPTILLLDAEGNVLAKTGYRRGGAGAYVKHLQQLLKK